MYFGAVTSRLSKDYRLAEKLIKDALLYEDRAAYIYVELGLLYDQAGDERTVEMYERASELSPNWVIPYANTASHYILAKDYTRAEEYAKIAIDIGPHYRYGYSTLSDIYKFTRRPQLSKDILQIYLDNYGGDWLIYYKLGMIAKSTDLQEAISYFKLSNGVRESKTAHQELGIAYYGVNDSLLLHHFGRALELYPTAPELLNNLGWFHYLKENYDLSLDYYERAVEEEPTMLFAQLNLGKLYYIKENWKEALSCLNTLLRT